MKTDLTFLGQDSWISTGKNQKLLHTTHHFKNVSVKREKKEGIIPWSSLRQWNWSCFQVGWALLLSFTGDIAKCRCLKGRVFSWLCFFRVFMECELTHWMCPNVGSSSQSFAWLIHHHVSTHIIRLII